MIQRTNRSCRGFMEILLVVGEKRRMGIGFLRWKGCGGNATSRKEVEELKLDNDESFFSKWCYGALYESNF